MVVPLGLLLAFPLGIGSGLTVEAIKKAYNKLAGEERQNFEKLFVNSFIKAINKHNKYYDNISRSALKNLKKEIKGNKDKLLEILKEFQYENYGNFINELKNENFQATFAKKVNQKYLPNLPKEKSEITTGMIKDATSFYLTAFFKNISQREELLIILEESLKIESITKLLENIKNEMINKEDLENLKKEIIDYQKCKINKDFQKCLNDYYSYLKRKFHYLELRGYSPKIGGKQLKIDLDKIYIPLKAEKDRPILSKILAEEIAIKKIDIKKIEERKRELYEKRISAKENVTIVKTKDILNNKKSVILGDPGSGKTTLLRYLAYHLGKDNGRDKKFDGILTGNIPLYLRISKFSESLSKNASLTLSDYITIEYDKRYNELFTYALENDKALVLIDGLDEVLDTSIRIEVTRQIKDLVSKYPDNRYIVTSRLIGYQEARLESDFQQFTVKSFDKDDIINFANNWYISMAKASDKNYKKAKSSAKELINSIDRNPSVMRLATNPLLMTIIAMIHYKGKKLPNKRVELYDVSTETFLDNWVRQRVQSSSHLKEVGEILEVISPIAFDIHTNRPSGLIAEKDFIDQMKKILIEIQGIEKKKAKKTSNEFKIFLRSESGFFFDKGEDEFGNRYFGFLHPTFEEYLSSMELYSRWEQGKLELKDYIYNSRWIEIIRLAAGFINLTKGTQGRIRTTEFIKAILDTEDDFPEACRALQLAGLILADDVKISPDLENKIINEIFNIWTKTPFNELKNNLKNIVNELLKSEKSEIIKNKIFKIARKGNTKSKVALISIITELSSYHNEAKKIWYELIGSKNLEVFLNTVGTIRWREKINEETKNLILKNVAEMDFDNEYLNIISDRLLEISQKEIIELINNENTHLQELVGRILILLIGFHREFSTEKSKEIVYEHVKNNPNLHNYYIFLNEILETPKVMKLEKPRVQSSSFRTEKTNLILCQMWYDFSESSPKGGILAIKSLNILSGEILNIKLDIEDIEDSMNIILSYSKDIKYEFPIILGLQMFFGLSLFWNIHSKRLDDLEMKFPSLFQKLLNLILNSSKSNNSQVRDMCVSFFNNPKLQNKKTIETLLRLIIDNEVSVYKNARQILNNIAVKDINSKILEKLLSKVNYFQKLIILNALKEPIDKELMKKVITDFRHESDINKKQSIFSILFEIKNPFYFT